MIRSGTLCLIAATLLASTDLAAQSTVYPSNGQTPDQMTNDKMACETWASGQTGYHPMQPTSKAAPTSSVAGQRLAGAARGAVRGGIVEERSDKGDREIDDPSRAGAAVGAAAGGARQRQARRQGRAETRQQDQTAQQGQAAYSQAFGSCMAGRGYTVQ